MAYVDFSGDTLFATPAILDRPEPVVEPVAAAPTGLSALEWSVVALAQRDRMASLREPSPLSIALGRVFGTRRRDPNLADPKLEALRRMAVLSWHRGFAVPVHELAAFFAAGFNTDQYETMLASISTAQASRKARA
jgi:hypothetical protein